MARALTVAFGLSGLGALAGAAVQEATTCGKAGDCAAEPDAAGLLQVRKEDTLSATYKLQSLSGWVGVDAENGLSWSLTAVQNQGQCGSCASFSASGQLGERLAKAGKNVNGMLSVQATLYAGHTWGFGDGCNGAFPSQYGIMYGQHGIPDAVCAPYKAGKRCTPNSNGAEDGCYQINWGSCYGSGSWINYGLGLSSRKLGGADDMQYEIYYNGPISACIYVYENFMNMAGPIEQNVYTKTEGNMVGGHAILLTGWGNTPDGSGTPVWKLKNQWGTTWGDGGYIFFLRGANLANIESYDVSAYTVTNAQAALLESGPVPVNQSSQTRAAPVSQSSQPRPAPPASTTEEVEGLTPGGWYEQEVQSGMAQQIIDAYKQMTGKSESVLKVHTRVYAGLGAKVSVDAPAGGDRGAGAQGQVFTLHKSIEAFVAGRGAGPTNGWSMA